MQRVFSVIHVALSIAPLSIILKKHIDLKDHKPMIQLKNIFFLIILLSVSACGYQLRGSIDLPDDLKSIFFHGASELLNKTAKKTLRASGGTLATIPQEAGIIIQVIREEMKRRVVSLSSSGRVNEYEVSYLLHFFMLDKAGKQLSNKQVIELSRDYFNNQEEVLGKDNEEKIIRNELYRHATQAIIRRSRIALALDKDSKE